jgi:HK97 family phage portal protein
MAKITSSFFSGVTGLLGYIGAGWYPAGSRDGMAPFRTVSSDSGITISSDAALQISTVWACVRLLAETIASLPIEMKIPDANGKLQLATASQTYRMLAFAPNSEMTAVEFWEMMIASLYLWGNAYAKKSRIAGRVVALIPLRPEFMTVYRDNLGVIRYRYQRGTQPEDMPADDILHIKGFGVDGLVGLSPIAAARQTLGRAIATDQASGGIFRSGISASGFITYEKSFLNDEQRDAVRDRIQAFTGSANAGKVMVLENGMTYKGITMNPADAQLIESRMFNIEDLCRWFRVPPQLVGHTDKSSSWASSLENVILWFVKSGLIPTLTRVEQGVRRSLGLPQSYYLRFKFDELLRGDSEARAALYASGSQNGWMGRDEIREREGLPAREDTDVLTVQSNLIPLARLEDMGGQPPPAAQEPMK